MPDPISDAAWRLPKARVAFLFAAPFLLVAAWVTPVVVKSYWHTSVPVTAVEEVSGANVYARHCAYCHGANGDGRGSVILHPPARYFGRDKFKFATTANGIPTDDDLKAILHRGIPGSAMPSFAALKPDEVAALIEHVRGLIRKGLFDRQVEKAIKEEEDVEHAKFARLATEMSIQGEKLTIPATFPPSTPEAIARGKTLFTSEAWGCAKCHGLEGRGDGPQTKDPKFINDDKTPAVPRDLTKGVFKGGSEPASLYARIRLGIPGTPMPDSKDKPEKDVFDVIHYIRSLSPNPVVTAPPAGTVTPSNIHSSGSTP